MLDSCEQPGLVVFLAPTVSLVRQQANVFRRQVELEMRSEEVREYFGMGNALLDGAKSGQKGMLK